MKKTASMFNLFLILIVFSTTSQAQLDTLSIIHISDTHICNLNGYHQEFVKLRKHYGNGFIPLKNFIHNMPRKLPLDALIITGDLIDYYEAGTADEEMLDTQIEQFTPLYAGSVVPVYLTLGNHDITSYWINDSTEKESSQLNAYAARAIWIRNIACFREGTYYERSFSVNKTTYHFLFLDNGYSLGNDSYLDTPQLHWLEGKVKQYTDEPVILFMHKYLPVPDLNGDGIVFTENQTVSINDQTCSRGFLRILNENKNIKALFCGHGHKNVSEWLSFPSGHTILQTEIAAFGSDTTNWRMLKFTADDIIICSPGGLIIEEMISTK